MQRRTKYDAELAHLSEISAGLRRIAGKLRGRDADAIKAALEALDGFRKITEDLNSLGQQLLDIEDTHKSDTANFPKQIGKADLAACILAMMAVNEFFHLRLSSRILQMLLDGLLEIAIGVPPAVMFHPEDYSKGRRADSPLVMGAKGAVAAIMHVQQSTGMSRKEAAEWVVGYISPALAARISRKPLTARTVEEWLDRFGGDHAEYNLGRENYLLWTGAPGPYAPVSPQRFREITENLARRLLVRKPK